MSRASRRWSRSLRGLAVALAGAIASSSAAAQTLGERVARVADGTAHLSYATRADVCGDGVGTIGFDDGRRMMRWSGGGSSGRGEWGREACEPGPARVALTVEGGRVTRLRLAVGRRALSGSGRETDLGSVPAPAAAAYLLSLAERSDDAVGRQAIVAAVVADGAVVWPELLRMARDSARPRATRREATFWLAEAAGDALGPRRAALDSTPVEVEVREQAVFALSQRPRDESVPALIRIARTNRDVQIRRRALFWLGQSGDARAIDLFESVLRRR
jgi:hypothetical protein